MFRMKIQDGFEGQNHYVFPRSFLKQVENHPLLHALFPTDIGWYPQARFHYRERLGGASETILIYCVAGSGWARVRQKNLTITPGYALIIPGGEPHVYGASLEEPWSIHWVHFRGETAYQFVQQLPPDEYMIPVDGKAHEPVIETFQECYDALTEEFTMRQMVFCALAIHRILAWVFFGNPAFQTAENTLPKAIDRALAYMREHLSQRPSLSDLAEHVGLSVSYFSYLFKDHLGVSPIDYFIHLKMQHACHLLKSTDMSVKQVAFTLDYDDPYYFSRLFRKVIGVSPANYRAHGV